MWFRSPELLVAVSKELLEVQVVGLLLRKDFVDCGNRWAFAFCAQQLKAPCDRLFESLGVSEAQVA